MTNIKVPRCVTGPAERTAGLTIDWKCVVCLRL